MLSRSRLRALLRSWWPFLMVLGGWTIYFALFWVRAIRQDLDGNIWAGLVNIWGDWAVHFTMGSRMAYGPSLWPHSSPLLLGAPLLYPFLPNMFSAILIRLGVPFWTAFTFPSFLFCVTAVAALLGFYWMLFRSRRVAIIGSFLFLLNGGLGWVYWLQELWTSDSPLMTALNPAHEFTRMDEQGIRWISVIDSMFIPQRALTVGLTSALTLLAYTVWVVRRKQPLAWWLQLLMGLWLGILPLLHTHSYIITSLFFGWIVVYEFFFEVAYKRTPLLSVIRNLLLKWTVTGAIGLTLSVGLISFTHLTESTATVVKLQPGWLAGEFQMSPLWFWLKNWGVIPLLALIGTVFIALNKKHRHALPWLLPSFALFVVANIWILQPWAWDNTKYFVWSSVGFSGAVGWLLVAWWDRIKQVRYRWLRPFPRLLIATLFWLCIWSGALDAYRILRVELHQYQMYSNEDLLLAEWVKLNTPQDSLWLNANNHNHWLFNLTGRQTLMAYPGWLWTHGYTYKNIEKDVGDAFRNGNKSPEILQKYDIDYVVVGPNERHEMRLNELIFLDQYPVVFESANTQIYKVSPN